MKNLKDLQKLVQDPKEPPKAPDCRLTSVKCSDGGLRTGAAGIPRVVIIICRFAVWEDGSRVKPCREERKMLLT